MTNEEAKFVLSAYRPNGADARSPALAEALKQAHQDPTLGAWFERSQTFDRTVAERLRTVQPPADLRATLLAGARISQTSRAWWQRPAVMMMAAAVVVLLAVGAVLWRGAGDGASGLSPAAIRQVAMADLGGAHPVSIKASGLGDFGAWLQDPANHLAAMPVDEVQLETDRCRTINVGGKRVFEICFKRDAWYHVYIAPREGFDTDDLRAGPRFEETGQVAMATWADSAHVYVLATAAGLNAVKRVL